jgi:hypothetical protein
VQSLDVVAATNALAHDQNVGYSPPAGASPKLGLQLLAERVLVEFDDVGCGDDLVFVEEDVLRLHRVGAVGFGENDDCKQVSDVDIVEIAERTWALLQNRIELHLHLMVLLCVRLALDPFAIPRLPAHRRNTLHFLPIAVLVFHHDAPRYRLVLLAAHGVQVLLVFLRPSAGNRHFPSSAAAIASRIPGVAAPLVFWCRSRMSVSVVPSWTCRL